MFSASAGELTSKRLVKAVPKMIKRQPNNISDSLQVLSGSMRVREKTCDKSQLQNCLFNVATTHKNNVS